MQWPKLPPKAAYLVLDNPKRRNALSFEALKSLKKQLVDLNTSSDGKLRLLPVFQDPWLKRLNDASTGSKRDYQRYGWLVDSSEWNRVRQDMPTVLVLRSEGPIFSSGHDLKEMRDMSHAKTLETFDLCAQVMTLMRRSPATIIGVVQGLATAAGAQLALSTDLPIACASTQFQLPGASIGLPCTSPSTILSRRLGNAFTYRMLALAEPMRADQLPGGAVETVPDPEALERRVAEMVDKLALRTPGQPLAQGKWAYWTQVGTPNDLDGSDGYESAAKWATRAMALHTRAIDAKEGMSAFIEKRPPVWKT